MYENGIRQLSVTCSGLSPVFTAGWTEQATSLILLHVSAEATIGSTRLCSIHENSLLCCCSTMKRRARLSFFFGTAYFVFSYHVFYFMRGAQEIVPIALCSTRLDGCCIQSCNLCRHFIAILCSIVELPLHALKLEQGRFSNEKTIYYL